MIKIKPELVNFIRPSEHSTYSPSAADRWIYCPASINLTKEIPEEPAGSYAEEGTMAHTVAEETFRTLTLGLDLSEKTLAEARAFSSYEDMIEGGEIYAKEVLQWLNHPSIGKVIWFGLERGVPIFPELGCFGTGDCLIIGELGCVVIDYKFGKKKVDSDSMQLRAYAAGIVKYLENVPKDYGIFSVVVQPRVNFSSEIFQYTLEEILNFTETIYNSIVASYSAVTPNRNGPNGSTKHCFWCPASRTKDPRYKCPAIKAETTAVMDNNFRGFLRDVSKPIESFSQKNEERDRALVSLISLAPIVVQAAKRAEEELMFRISEGQVIPGIELASQEGKSQWALPEAIIWEKLNAKYPDKASKFTEVIPAKTKLKTLTELRKILGKDSLNELTVKKLSKVLKPTDQAIERMREAFLTYGEDE